MDDIGELQNYFRKLKKMTEMPDFRFWGNCYINKSKIDDLFCCILALLPENFKAATIDKSAIGKYPSVAAFNLLYKRAKIPFFFSNNLYIYNADEVKALISTVSRTIERDLRLMENM